MNRAEFMGQLETLLRGISPTEREEALQYYNDYFDDAGSESEQDVIEALGNPARVAENIKRDLLESGYGDGAPQRKASASGRELVEYGREEEETQDIPPYVPKYREEPALPQESDKNGKTQLPAWAVALIVTLIILSCPLLVGLFGCLVGLLASWFVLVCSFGIVSLGLFVVMAGLIVVGIMCMFTDPLGGLALVGGGLVCGGAGILLLLLTVVLAGIVTPAIFKGIASLFRLLTKVKEK